MSNVILHIIMYRTPRALYGICNYFTNFIHKQYMRTYILLHVVPTFFTIASPKYGIQTFKVVDFVWLLLLLSFDVFVPTSTHPLLF